MINTQQIFQPCHFSQALETKSLIEQCMQNDILGPLLKDIDWIEIGYADDRNLVIDHDQAAQLNSLGSVFIVNLIINGSGVVYHPEFFDNVIGKSFKEVVTILGLQDRYWSLFI